MKGLWEKGVNLFAVTRILIMAGEMILFVIVVNFVLRIIGRQLGAKGWTVCRLLMNLLQMEFDVLPTKVLKEDKAEYIQALIDTREQEDINIFLDCMARLHCQHLKSDINQYLKLVVSTTEMVDKQALKQKMVDKWSIKPSLAEKLVDILEFVADKDEFTTEQIVSHFGFNTTTAKRYLRQLTEFGYLEPHGGNKNRTYGNKK